MTQQNLKVTKIYFNWFYTDDGGEDYFVYEINKCNVIEITHHKPQGHGDAHYCTVYFKDGSETIIYNLNQVEFKNETI